MVLYLVLLLLTWFDFLGYNFIPLDENLYIVFILLLLLYGMAKYREAPKTVTLPGKSRLFKMIVAGVALSVIPAYFFWGQSFLQSVLTYKEQYTWLIIPALFVISPKEEDIIKALKIFFIFMVVAYIGKILMPGLFLTEGDLNNIDKGEEDITVAGYELTVLILCYYLQKIRNNFSVGSFLFLLCVFLFIFGMKNRSTLFPCALFVGLSMLQIKSRFRILILILMLGVVTFVFLKTVEVWIELVNQTITDTSNEDYARNMSYAYYIFEYSPHWLCCVLGNGFISTKVNPIFADLLEMQMTQSDVGYIGFWNQFGILPIIAFVITSLIAFRTKDVPYYLKLLAAFLLICSPTISYYGSRYHSILYALYYYLLFVNLQHIYDKRGVIPFRGWIRKLVM